MNSGFNKDCRSLEKRIERSRCRRLTAKALSIDWLKRLSFGSNKDLAQLVQLWLGIFAVNWRQLPNPAWLNRQISTIENFQFSTYPKLLAALLEDPAILHSLNGFRNHRKNPNENLGRELLELYSIGEGNFTEVDVQQVALALTGYRLGKNQEVVLIPHRHDPGPQTILGRTANFNAHSLAYWLCKQPATSIHICKRVWKSWIGTDPSPKSLKSFASSWYQNNLSLPWLYTNLPKQEESIQSNQLGLRLLDPIHVVTRSLQLLGSHHPNAFEIALSIQSSMGQPPFSPPSVKGWPQGEQWLSTKWIVARKRGLLRLLADEEVWASRSLPIELKRNLVPFDPINLSLPTIPSKENIALLFTDPSWQFSGPMTLS